MPLLEPVRPPDPCTSSELLDYLVALDRRQAEVYKSLMGGGARSSYSISHCGDDTFDMFVSIAGSWVTMSRKKFLKFHGDGEDWRIWRFYE